MAAKGFRYVEVTVDPGGRGLGRIPAGRLRYIASGGQGHVYELSLRGSRYIVKVFHGGVDPSGRISAIYSRLIDWRRRTGRSFPESLSGRALPVAIGRTDAGDTVLIYNYLEEFTPLDKILDPSILLERYGWAERLRWIHEAVAAFAVLEDAGILLSDVSPDNFAVAGRGGAHLYLVDLEGASPRDMLDKYPPYYKRVPFFMPLDIEYNGHRLGPVLGDEKAIMYHDLWYGLQLIASAATGLAPFEWLSNKYYTPRGYAEAIGIIERYGASAPTWPPFRDERIIRLLASRGIIDVDAYTYMALIYRRFARLAAALYAVFYRSLVEALPRPPITYTRLAAAMGVM